MKGFHVSLDDFVVTGFTNKLIFSTLSFLSDVSEGIKAALFSILLLLLDQSI